MYICVHVYARTLENYTYGVGSVLLFVTKGNTRASESGTAIVQSRFFVMCLYKRRTNNI